MNVELLQKVKEHILAEPRRLNMDVLARRPQPESAEQDLPPCGTVACIAGWTHILTLPIFPTTDEEIDKAEEVGWDSAQEKLGLDHTEAERLFYEPWRAIGSLSYSNCWPKNYAKRYNDAKTAQERAQVTAERIDHFIATDGKQ